MVAVKEKSEKLLALNELKATHKLKQLAKAPFDLSLDGNLTSQRLAQFQAEACGYHFLYGTERVTEEVMFALQELAYEAQALQKMEKMQAGEVMNFIQGYPSENRPVLHTAARDFFTNPNPAKAAVAAAHQAKKELDKLKVFLNKIDKEHRFTDMICVAIGGSDLGPKAHYLALQHLLKPGRKVHFISNIDPDEAAMVLSRVQLDKTLVLIISKSGTTLETITNEAFVRSYYVNAGLNPESYFVSITGEGSPMDDKSKYLECFYIWDWIGGRYSTTSMVGGVMLSFAFGIDTYVEFLKGASAMDKAALSADLDTNLPLLGALLGIWNRNFLGYPNLGVIPYSQALSRYAAHIQQVDMESNGKRIDQQGRPVDFSTGPIVFGEPGTSAQHSFYQLLHQGTDIIPLELIGFKLSQYEEDIDIQQTTSQQKLLANLFAQSIALATGKSNENPNKVFIGNRPSHIILGKQLVPFSLGALLAYFEHKVAFQGFIWGINSFDQEGVQLGKELSHQIIDRFAVQNGAPVKNAKPYALGDAYLKILEKL